MSSQVALRGNRHHAGLLACTLGGLLSLWSESSIAQDTWGGSLAVTSDYRVRGLSRTRGDGAIQGGVHAQPLPGWTTGAWASSVSRNRGRDAAIEIDAYTGYGWNIAKDWDAKLVYTHYWYPDDPAQSSYDHDEVAATLAFRSQLFATVAWSPNIKYFSRYRGRWHAAEGASASFELSGLQPITASFSLVAGVGYNDLREIFEAGYWYWNAGVSYAVGPVQLDVSRIDSDAAAERLFGSTVTEAGWSAAVSWRF